MMWMACAAVISACSPSPAAEPAVLPPEEQVRTVSVERDGVAADCGNREQIGELLDSLLKQAVQAMSADYLLISITQAKDIDTFKANQFNIAHEWKKFVKMIWEG